MPRNLAASCWDLVADKAYFKVASFAMFGKLRHIGIPYSFPLMVLAASSSLIPISSSNVKLPIATSIESLNFDSLLSFRSKLYSLYLPVLCFFLAQTTGTITLIRPRRHPDRQLLRRHQHPSCPVVLFLAHILELLALQGLTPVHLRTCQNKV